MSIFADSVMRRTASSLLYFSQLEVSRSVSHGEVADSFKRPGIEDMSHTCFFLTIVRGFESFVVSTRESRLYSMGLV